MVDNVIPFPKKRIPSAATVDPTGTNPTIVDGLPPNFWDLVARAQHSGDPRLDSLVRGIFYLIDTVDSIEMVASQCLIDSGNERDPFDPYHIIAEMCRAVRR